MFEALLFGALWESLEWPNNQLTPRAGPLPMTEPEYSVELSPTVELEYSAEFLSMVELGPSSVPLSRTTKEAAPEFETSQDPRLPYHSLLHRRREHVS